MADTQKWVVGLSVYFMLLFILVGVMSAGNLLFDSGLDVDTDFDIDYGGYNSSDIPTSTWSFDWFEYFDDLTSFFGWGVDYYDAESDVLMKYFWIFRIIFVWLPALALLLSLFYSIWGT